MARLPERCPDGGRTAGGQPGKSVDEGGLGSAQRALAANNIDWRSDRRYRRDVGGDGDVTRSIPEKTLEHWSSMYMVNRFPNASLWWPADGEDIAFDLLQTAAGGDGKPGKVLLLEMKTTEWLPKLKQHRLTVDLDQLDKYLNSPRNLDLPVFYVFPVPFWDGAFSAPSTAMPVTGTLYPPDWWRQKADYLPYSLGYEWFGNWLYVLPAELVAKALPSGWTSKLKNKRINEVLAATRQGKRPPSSVACNENLFALPPRVPVDTTATFWENALSALSPAETPQRWRDFWQQVQTCNSGFGTRWTTEGEAYRLSLRIRTADNDEGHVAEEVDLASFGPDPGSRPAEQRQSGIGIADGNTMIIKLPSFRTEQGEFWGRAPLTD